MAPLKMVTATDHFIQFAEINPKEIKKKKKRKKFRCNLIIIIKNTKLTLRKDK